jgi:hypothetical protein
MRALGSARAITYPRIDISGVFRPAAPTLRRSLVSSPLTRSPRNPSDPEPGKTAPPIEKAAEFAPDTPPVTTSPLVQRYAPRLHAIALRTGVPLPSLAIAFLILHELTAIIPLVILFFVFQSIGAGAAFVAYLSGIAHKDPESRESGDSAWDWRGVLGGWVNEGQKRVERVGRRYGILGYRKKGEEEFGDVVETANELVEEAHSAGRDLTRRAERPSGSGGSGGSSAGEGVANAIAAYVVVKVSREHGLVEGWYQVLTCAKALLPVRIGVSIAAAPAFARYALEPIRRLGLRLRGASGATGSAR